MSIVAVLLVGLLGVLVMGANREAGADARTLGQILAAIRAAGWRSALYALAGVIAVAALVACSMSGLVLTAAAKTVYGLAMVLAALAWHMRGLTAATPHREPFAMPPGEAA